MGCNVKEKPPRGRKHRHSSALTAGKLTIPDPNPNSSPNPSPNSSPNPNPNPNSLDESVWGYCTEEQLEELLLKNLDYVYKEALARLISLNYDENLAIRALLSNGHCYGSMDVLSNVLHNAIAFLNSSSSSSSSGEDSSASAAAAFSDFRHLQEYSLAGMVCLLQQVRPHLSRGDAMWCLLMSELHVGRATTIEIPSPAAPPLCKLHADPKPIPRRKVVPRLKAAAVVAETEESDIVATVMENLENMSIGEEEEEKPEDQKREMILDLVKQIRDLENQVNERKEWAQQKAVQAAKKLSNDLTELKVLRMEREENQRVKKGKQALEDRTMKRLAEMEGELKKASGQVDRANAVVHRLEAENAEIRAEMEACKLSAAESAAACLEVAKRERRCLKRLLAWEKQRDRLQGEVAKEREGIARLQRQLEEVFVAQKEAEVKWRQETKAKEQAIALVEEERRAKEAADASIKREHETLRRKIEIDFQRHKDDIHRLEEEIFRLRASAGPTQPPTPSPNTLSTGDSEISKPAQETNIKLVQGFNKPKDPSQMVNRNRECILCMKDEVSVVFLPCAHQVVCTSCNEDHERRAKTTCPCCSVNIEERIHVYGATS